MSEFQKSILEWNNMRKKIDALTDELKKLRQEEKTKSEYILSCMEEKPELKDQIFAISDGHKIKYTESKKVDGLTQKLLLEQLTKFFKGDHEKAKKLVEYILEGRQTHTTSSLKITGALKKADDE